MQSDGNGESDNPAAGLIERPVPKLEDTTTDATVTISDKNNGVPGSLDKSPKVVFRNKLGMDVVVFSSECSSLSPLLYCCLLYTSPSPRDS